MGWSYTRSAGRTMRAFESFCRESTGTSNAYKENNVKKFIEWDRVEQPDGGIVGELCDFATCQSLGRIRITPEGKFIAPQFLVLVTETFKW